MKKESYDKVRRLLSNIDELINSADITSGVLESVKKNGGTAKIYAHTGGETYGAEINSKTMEVVFADILHAYHDSIREKKAEINKILDSTIGE